MVAMRIHNLSTATATAAEGFAIVTVIGAVNSRSTLLANAALHLTLPLPSADPPAKGAPLLPPLCAAAPPEGPLVLSLEGLDAADRAVAADRENALGLVTALAGVVVVAVRQADLLRLLTSALYAALCAIEKSLSLRAAGTAPPLPSRRLIVVAVSDFDDAEVSAEDVETYVTEYVEGQYAFFDLPPGYAATQFEDLFDTRVVLLPSELVSPDAHAAAVEELGSLLRSANRDYADAGMTADRMHAAVERVATATSDDPYAAKDLPADHELDATFACSSVMTAVLDKFKATVKQWRGTVDQGRIIRNFGAEADALIQRTLAVFDSDAAAHKATRAFARKRDELKSVLLAECYALFTKQILKLREVAYQVFRGKLARIRINDQVEKNVRNAVKEAETYFVNNADALRSQLGGWRFDNERHELVNHMRDDATERLQLARLQGSYVPPMRAPIAFAFHTLLLAPFGRDSRSIQPHEKEMQQVYDPDKIKKAGLMRSRPHQRNYKFTVSSKDEVGQETVDAFADLFADAPKK